MSIVMPKWPQHLSWNLSMNEVQWLACLTELASPLLIHIQMEAGLC